MNDKTKENEKAKADQEKKLSKAEKERMIDPYATSPSKDESRDKDAAKTASEPNSKERIGKKVSRTGRNNGGDDRPRPGVGRDMTADRLGEREAVSPGETDVIWTNESKDRWGVGQPSTADLLKQRNKIAQDLAEADKK